MGTLIGELFLDAVIPIIEDQLCFYLFITHLFYKMMQL